MESGGSRLDASTGSSVAAGTLPLGGAGRDYERGGRGRAREALGVTPAFRPGAPRRPARCRGGRGGPALRVGAVRAARAPLAFHAHPASVGPHGSLGKEVNGALPARLALPRAAARGTCSRERVLPPLAPPHARTPARGVAGPLARA